MSCYAEEDLFAESKSRFYRDWSLGSYSVPEDGKLYEMYHGTTVEAAEDIIKNGFKLTRNGKLGSGVYVSRGFVDAAKFPKNLSPENVILKLRVNVGKCIKIDVKGHPMQKTWQCQYDFAWIPYGNPLVGTFQERNCIADPRRIKVIGIWHAPVGQKSRLAALIEPSTKCSAAPREAAQHCEAGREQESAISSEIWLPPPFSLAPALPARGEQESAISSEIWLPPPFSLAPALPARGEQGSAISSEIWLSPPHSLMPALFSAAMRHTHTP